ncbi:hypothetical protein ECANGB1_127 [Enterospora canceri]|uniref:Uncharacterized protein n=1 Tax=Enterospora canceri TaxID=1081671 RepID=A0A1Y1S8B2_9MICR|nr:hypothetical protein ECANGB1_127 [Enterospora canceri]
MYTVLLAFHSVLLQYLISVFLHLIHEITDVDWGILSLVLSSGKPCRSLHCLGFDHFIPNIFCYKDKCLIY